MMEECIRYTSSWGVAGTLSFGFDTASLHAAGLCCREGSSWLHSWLTLHTNHRLDQVLAGAAAIIGARLACNIQLESPIRFFASSGSLRSSFCLFNSSGKNKASSKMRSNVRAVITVRLWHFKFSRRASIYGNFSFVKRWRWT